jgi:hypothetical protein
MTRNLLNPGCGSCDSCEDCPCDDYEEDWYAMVCGITEASDAAVSPATARVSSVSGSNTTWHYWEDWDWDIQNDVLISFTDWLLIQDTNSGLNVFTLWEKLVSYTSTFEVTLYIGTGPTASGPTGPTYTPYDLTVTPAWFMRMQDICSLSSSPDRYRIFWPQFGYLISGGGYTVHNTTGSPSVDTEFLPVMEATGSVFTLGLDTCDFPVQSATNPTMTSFGSPPVRGLYLTSTLIARITLNTDHVDDVTITAGKESTIDCS